MSKITNDGLTRSGTGCFIAVPTWQLWASKGFNFFEKYVLSLLCPGRHSLSESDLQRSRHACARTGRCHWWVISDSWDIMSSIVFTCVCLYVLDRCSVFDIWQQCGYDTLWNVWRAARNTGLTRTNSKTIVWVLIHRGSSWGVWQIPEIYRDKITSRTDKVGDGFIV